MTRRACRGRWGGRARGVCSNRLCGRGIGFVVCRCCPTSFSRRGARLSRLRDVLGSLYCTPPSAGPGRHGENNKKCMRARPWAEVRPVTPSQKWPCALLVVCFPFTPHRAGPPRLLRSRAGNPREIRCTHWSGPPMPATARPRVCGPPRLAAARHCGGWRGGAAARGPRSCGPDRCSGGCVTMGIRTAAPTSHASARASLPQPRVVRLGRLHDHDGPRARGGGVPPGNHHTAHTRPRLVRRTAARHRRSRGHRPPPQTTLGRGAARRAPAPPPAAARAVHWAPAPFAGRCVDARGTAAWPTQQPRAPLRAASAARRRRRPPLAQCAAAGGASILAPCRRSVGCVWVWGGRPPSCR